MFKIVQEACINIIDHSGGNMIKVNLVKDEFINLSIEDNGIGLPNDIENNEKHFGLKIMQERTLFLNGIYEIISNKKGTKIIIKIPLEKENKNEY